MTLAFEKLAPHGLRCTCIRLCHLTGGELDQIQFLLGHVSIQTSERYLGCKQRLRDAPRPTRSRRTSTPGSTWTSRTSGAGSPTGTSSSEPADVLSGDRVRIGGVRTAGRLTQGRDDRALTTAHPGRSGGPRTQERRPSRSLRRAHARIVDLPQARRPRTSPGRDRRSNRT